MDRNQLFPLDKVESMVDLGVRFDNNLTFRDHSASEVTTLRRYTNLFIIIIIIISEKINKAYSVLGIIKRNFI